MTDNKDLEQIPAEVSCNGVVARQGEKLLASADLGEEVARLDPLDAYYIVRDLGLGRGLPILRALSPEQLTTCVDLDCWSRYDFTVDSLDEWLTAFSLAGPEALAEAFFSLNYVVQLLFLAKTVIVFDPDTDEVPPAEGNGPIRAMTPDGFYLLELKTDLVLKLHPFSVLDSLYQYDLSATHQLLSTVRVDLSMQIEEEALRFRNGRLEDLGFVTPDEASTLFSQPGSRQPAARAKKPVESIPVSLPSVYVADTTEDGLFQQALSRITDQDFLSRLQQELVWTTNTAIIAYGEKTKATKEITGIAERVRDTISLGLESLLHEDDPNCFLDDTVISKAIGLLGDWLVSDLFKQGFWVAIALQKEVREALLKPCLQDWFDLETAQQSEESGDLLDRAFVTAILGRHPLRSGFDFAHPDAVKAFSCLADLDVAHVRLKRLVERICG